MSLIRQSNSEMFMHYLSVLNEDIRLHGKENMLSINITAEIFFRLLLNYLYDWSLKNTNQIKHNYPGIDLIDENNKIVIQITSDYSGSKINSTLNKKIMAELKQDGYKLKFCFIGSQNTRHKTVTIKNKYEISYNPQEDLIISDLVDAFNNLENVTKQEKIIDFLCHEFGEKFKISDEYIKKQMDKSLKNLGPRYTPLAHVDTSTITKLESFVFSEVFIKSFQDLQLILKNQLNSLKITKEFRNYNIFNDIKNELSNFMSKKCNIIKEDALKLNTISKELSQKIYDLNYQELTEAETNCCFICRKIINDIEIFFADYPTDLIDAPILLIEGGAGIGKSHLVADFCKKLPDEDYACFLYLGQFFIDGIHPWEQIVRQSGLEISFTEYLEQLDLYSKRYNKKVILVIDALNEGEGRIFWKKYIQSLVNEISEFNFKLILTIRDTYSKLIFTEEFLKMNNVFKVKHKGFENVEFDAVSEYCKYYKLNEPTFPILDEIYINPLMLKITCEGLSKRGIKVLKRNYSYKEIFESYIFDVNEELSRPEHLDYDEFNLVEKSLLAIVSHPEYKYGQLNYSKAFLVVKDAVCEYCSDDSSKHFLKSLINNNIINFAQYKDENILFSYEKMGDYYMAKSIILEIKENVKSSKNLLNFSDRLKKMIEDSSSISFNRGVLEILAVLIPNEFNVEIFELLSFSDDDDRELDVAEIFIESLLWRTVSVLNDKLNLFVKNSVLKWTSTIKLFIDVLIKLSFEKNNVFNAKYLHEFLSANPQKIRDAFWTVNISTNSSLSKLIDWAWTKPKKIPKDSLLLLSILFTWSFTSTNKKVRDCSTKVLSNLIIEQPTIAIELFDKFVNNDDDYILERLYCSIYGALVHSQDSIVWKELAPRIYRKVYQGDETFPNIVVRKFAYLIIKKICKLNEINITKQYPLVDTEGHSHWYNSLPTNQMIDEFEESIINKYGDRSAQSSSCYHIIHSMTTEYGRGVGGYGDFGRYVLGSLLRDWSNQFDDQQLSNIITWNILNDSYDFDGFSDFDNRISRYYLKQEPIERLGKKYQWIGMHRLLARLIDNFPPYTEKKIYDDTLDYCAFSKSSTDEIEHIVKIKKSFINDPWLKYYASIKEIDPTYIWKNPVPLHDIQHFTNLTTMCVENNLELCKINECLENMHMIEYHSKKYMSLYIYYNYDVKNKEKKKNCSLTWFNGACLIKKGYEQLFINNHLEINGNGVPEITYLPFFLYDYCEGDVYCYNKEQYIDDMTLENVEHIPLIECYFWEAYNDVTLYKNKSIAIPLPAEILVKSFDLKMKNIMDWYSSSNELVCLINQDKNGNTSVLIDFEKIKLFLEQYDYTLAFGEYVELQSKGQCNRIWQSLIFDIENDNFNIYKSDEQNYLMKD